MSDWLKKKAPIDPNREIVPLKKCPTCATSFQNTSYKLCPEDGTELVVYVPPENWFSKIRKIDHRFCPKCEATFKPHKVKCSVDFADLKFAGEEDIEIPVVAERYRLHAPIGREKMFDSYLARDLEAEDPNKDLVLVNFLAPELKCDPKTVSRFLKLAKTAVGLEHPNLLAVHEVNVTADGSPYMVSDFIAYGRTFEYELWKRGTMTEVDTVHAYIDILEALQYAHERGITHGAISMTNLIVKRQDEPRPRGFLSNFGVTERLLRQLDWDGPSTETRTSGIYGDPSGICPEFSRGARATSASDIYQIGCTLYQALTARTPFERENVTAVLIAHMEDEPDDIRVWVPEISEVLSKVVQKCLKKEPAERPTARALITELKETVLY